jgi:hypothetical protein
MIIRLGQISLSDVVPLLADMAALLSTAQGIAVAQLTAQLAGIANVLGAITVAPPALGATISAALATVASLQAAISGPTVTLQATALLALKAELEAQLAILTTSLPIPNATISAYVYDGNSGSIGAELQSEIIASMPGSSPSDRTRALILATTSSAAWEALAGVFKVTS